MKLTLIIKKGQNGFLIGQLKELPAVFTQGLTVDEVKENIMDALELHLEDLREDYVSVGDMNCLNGKRTQIPRHAEIDNDLCALVCKQLDIPKPSIK